MRWSLRAALVALIGVSVVGTGQGFQVQGPPRQQLCLATCNTSDSAGGGGTCGNYSLLMACYDIENGRCPPNGADCFWVCGMKILVNGHAISCPTLPGGGIDYAALAANPGAYPDCAEWHLPANCPQWSSPTGHTPPSNGSSEVRGLATVLDCGQSDLQLYTAASCGSSQCTLTGTFSFQCGSPCH